MMKFEFLYRCSYYCAYWYQNIQWIFRSLRDVFSDLKRCSWWLLLRLLCNSWCKNGWLLFPYWSLKLCNLTCRLRRWWIWCINWLFYIVWIVNVNRRWWMSNGRRFSRHFLNCRGRWGATREVESDGDGKNVLLFIESLGGGLTGLIVSCLFL